MLKPVRMKDGWVVKNKKGTLLASLTARGNFHGDVRYWPALLDAVTAGKKCFIHNINGWKEVNGEVIKYRDYPFVRLFMHWHALLDAVTAGEKCFIHNINGWKEVNGEVIKYRDYPFVRLFMHMRNDGWLGVSERFTGRTFKCAGWMNVRNKRRNALAVIKERGEMSFLAGIRKHITSGLSPTYEGINVNQYLDGWESTLSKT